MNLLPAVFIFTWKVPSPMRMANEKTFERIQNWIAAYRRKEQASENLKVAIEELNHAAWDLMACPEIKDRKMGLHSFVVFKVEGTKKMGTLKGRLLYVTENVGPGKITWQDEDGTVMSSDNQHPALFTAEF